MQTEYELRNKILSSKEWVNKKVSSDTVTIENTQDNRVGYYYNNHSSKDILYLSYEEFLTYFMPYKEEVKKIPILKGSINIGRKDDSNKPRYSLLPRGTINQVVQVLEYGASDKYEVDNWQRIPDARRRFYDAAMRHIDAWWNGEINDLDKDGVKGSQLPHLAHAICCLLFLMWFDNKGDE